MIVGLDIENFRGIRSTNGPVPLSRFHLLVGPNGGGKSTFLDAFAFIRDCLDDRVGPRQAVRNRAPNPADLTYLRRGGDIRLGFWLAPNESSARIWYRIGIGWDSVPGVVVRSEELSLVPTAAFESIETLRLKPEGAGLVRRLLYQENGYHWIVPEDWEEDADCREGEPPPLRDPYRIERDPHHLFMSHARVWGGDFQYESLMWARDALRQGIRKVELNAQAMRTPAGVDLQANWLTADGRNLPRVLARLLRGEIADEGYDPRFMVSGSIYTPAPPYLPARAVDEWIEHLRLALPDVRGIRCGRRDDDNAEYFFLQYQDGFECPMWSLSDGTLRTMALTLLPFLDPREVMYLVEEPENGVHPHNLEIIFSALQSVPCSQVLVATHSPYLIDLAGPEPLLCFRRGIGGVSIIPGRLHPALADQENSVAVSSLFANRLLE